MTFLQLKTKVDQQIFKIFTSEIAAFLADTTNSNNDFVAGLFLRATIKHAYILNHYLGELKKIAPGKETAEESQISELREKIQSNLRRLEAITSGTTLSHHDFLEGSIRENDFELFEIALANGADVNQKGLFGEVMLINVIAQGDERFIDRLLESAALDLNAQNGDYETALFYLCKYASPTPRRTDLFTRLVRLGANPNIPDRSGETPLMAAIDNEHFDIVKFLLAQEDIYVTTGQFDGPLKRAILKGHLETVKALLAKKVELPRLALSYACGNGFVDIAKLIVEFQSPTQGELDDALVTAVEDGQQAAVEYLLSLPGIDVNAFATNHPELMPLVTAIKGGQAQIAQLLITHGASKENAQAQLKCNNLSFAAALGDIEAVRKLLVSEKSTINEQDEAGYTALSRAVIARQLAIVKLLLDAGADVNLARKHCNRTPLLDAIVNDDEAVVRELLKVPTINLEAFDGGAVGTAKEIAHRKNLTSIFNMISKVEQTRGEKQLEELSITNLIEALKDYRINREANPNEYFHFFSALCGGYSRTEKLNVVEKLRNRLTNEGPQEIITEADMKIFRQGSREQSLANTIAQWEKESGEKFDEFINKLNESLSAASQHSPT